VAIRVRHLIDLFSIRALGLLDLAFDPRRSRFDVNTLDTPALNIPMELRLELMATIGSDLLD
jgi:hypothetical protein